MTGAGWDDLQERIYDRWTQTVYEVDVNTGEPVTFLMNDKGYVQDEYVSGERLLESALPVIAAWIEEHGGLLDD